MNMILIEVNIVIIIINLYTYLYNKRTNKGINNKQNKTICM